MHATGGLEIVRVCAEKCRNHGYVERKIRPKRADHATRVALALLSPVVPWLELLTIVRPDTLVRSDRGGESHLR
jgi:hypothetical protein